MLPKATTEAQRHGEKKGKVHAETRRRGDGKNGSRLFIAVGVMGLMMAALAIAGLAGNSDPAAASEALKYFSPDDIARGRSYFARGIVPALAYRALALCLVAFFVFRHRGMLSLLEKKIRRPVARLFAYSAAVFVSLEVLAFPFAVMSGFYRNRLFGLLNADFPLWLYRYLVSGAIDLVLTAAGIALFLAVAGSWRRYRLVVPGAFLVLALAGAFLHSRVYIPLFHDVVPLEEGELRTKIDAVLSRAGVAVSGIYVVDESRYTKRGNAYFTGWGRYRQIHLYDTLLRGHSADEVCAVVAHELCHYREEHVLIGLVLGTLGLFLGLIVIDRLCSLLLGENLAAAARSAKVPHIILVFFLVLFIARPVINGVTRVLERRCDAYALELTGRPEVFIEMERKLAVANRAHILPHPLFHWYYGTHPPVLERIRAGELFSESRAGK